MQRLCSWKGGPKHNDDDDDEMPHAHAKDFTHYYALGIAVHPFPERLDDFPCVCVRAFLASKK